jgi:hypothetical protein
VVVVLVVVEMGSDSVSLELIETGTTKPNKS